MNHFRSVCRSVRCKAVQKVGQELDKYTEENRQIDMLNIDFINFNAKGPGIIVKSKVVIKTV